MDKLLHETIDNTLILEWKFKDIGIIKAKFINGKLTTYSTKAKKEKIQQYTDLSIRHKMLMDIFNDIINQPEYMAKEV